MTRARGPWVGGLNHFRADCTLLPSLHSPSSNPPHPGFSPPLPLCVVCFYTDVPGWGRKQAVLVGACLEV
ncbi:hypothetical protein OJAV_G00181900 [Oryzias javanicus]|uniref:Uncharacterized protein n=1 Tax=Oryzias javanicus TaxID=123683 RepID=A0A3S2PGL1_ORYJA|nr:hypothetical protein OJAV_G00181900 [Oryzias javanicus]